MRWRHLAIGSLLVILGAARADASDDGPSGDAGRFSVTVAAGTHAGDGGDVEAVSVGYRLLQPLTLVLNVERNPVPTRVTRYANGYSATRGGTSTTASGELRVTVWQGRWARPFGLVGAGAGTSRLNVNEFFPTPVTNSTRTFSLGGGVIFPIRPALAISADAKFVLMAEAGEAGAMLPIRAGVTWFF